MLILPRAFWLAGTAPALLVAAGTAVSGIWTLYLSVALYLEYKQRMVRDEKNGKEWLLRGKRVVFFLPTLPPSTNSQISRSLWFNSACGTRRTRVTQYHDVVGELGGRAASIVALVATLASLFGVGVAQILACATNSYAAVPGLLSKRSWAAAWGGAMALCAFVPSYRSMRMINFFAAIGTTFTAWYVVAASVTALRDPTRPPPSPIKWWPTSADGFFVGASLVSGAMGAHTIVFEVLDASHAAAKFTSAFALGQIYVWTLTLPHSIAANAAFGAKLAVTDSVYGVLPPSRARDASAWLMNTHQVLVYAFVLLPLFLYSERLMGVHTRGYGARLLARAPVVALVLLAALAFPFYAAVNSLLVAVSVPALSYVLPCAVYNWVYRDAAARDAAPKPAPTFGIFTNRTAWTVAFAVNWVLAIGWGVAGGGFGIYYAIRAIVERAHEFGVFAPCYQCPKVGAVAG